MKDGGPAFPCAKERHAWFPGMTLRDYFAANALQGMISANVGFFDTNKAREDANLAARSAYEYADAMLKAREL